MTYEEICNHVTFDYYVSKDEDANGQVTEIRLVGISHKGVQYLSNHGYELTYVGCNALFFNLKK